VQAWDKALYFLNRLAQQRFRFVWLIEYDVFIPGGPAAFLAVHRAAVANASDAVHAYNNPEMTRNTQQWAWARVTKVFKNHFPIPWFTSMVCALGLSSRMLNATDEYARKHGQLEYLEAFFPTLAHHAGMRKWNPGNFSTIIYPSWHKCGDVIAHPAGWFHPVKDIRRFNGSCWAEWRRAGLDTLRL
jgi:hypothetical protein